MMAARRTDKPCSHLEAWGAIAGGVVTLLTPKTLKTILKILPPGITSLLPGVTSLPPNKTQNKTKKKKKVPKKKKKVAPKSL
jgi:hypothetical protein